MGFILHYVLALAAVALMLVGLQASARAYVRRRSRGSVANRIVTIIESTPLTQQAALHVIHVEARRFLIGVSPNGVVLLAVLREPED
ncbi:MAG TPA: flagellar biosynthetic protein FliO [Candidatus Rubrimentiphilum sp.]|nr:flagellar biosynthetic protein FliO [Candidatus Rubrimentiphilum sp.]